MESPSKIEQENINFCLKTHLDKINSLLDTHALLKKTSKCKLKFKTKAWITPGLQISIPVKNKLLIKIIHLKEPHKELHSYNEYKNYRNMLSGLLKRSKQSYFPTVFNLTGIIQKILGKE